MSSSYSSSVEEDMITYYYKNDMKKSIFILLIKFTIGDILFQKYCIHYFDYI